MEILNYVLIEIGLITLSFLLTIIIYSVVDDDEFNSPAIPILVFILIVILFNFIYWSIALN